MSPPDPRIPRRKLGPQPLPQGPRPARPLIAATHRITLPTVAALLALAAFGCAAEQAGDEVRGDPPRRRAVASSTHTGDPGSPAGLHAGLDAGLGAIEPTPMPLPGEAMIVVPAPIPSATALAPTGPKPPATSAAGPPPSPHVVKGAMPLVRPRKGDPGY